MTWIDLTGYLASLLVLLTFCMRTMVTLRAVAICSNLAFITYGMNAAIYPVLVLHLILAPLNTVLLVRVLRVVRRAKAAAKHDLSAAWLQPFMRLRKVKQGQVIFRKDDYADALYLIAAGRVELAQSGITLGPGDVFGEIGLFSVDRRRTQGARAASEGELLWIKADELKKLCERNPGLSLYFLRLVSTRFAHNVLAASPMAQPASARTFTQPGRNALVQVEG